MPDAALFSPLRILRPSTGGDEAGKKRQTTPPIMNGVMSFFQEVRQEMEKVTWPSREQGIRLTLMVLAASMVVAVYIGGLDFIFTRMMALLVK